jgi:cysteine-rich repeat protein
MHSGDTWEWDGTRWFGFSYEQCGNEILEIGETCDDGNLAAGDGCSSTCQLE